MGRIDQARVRAGSIDPDAADVDEATRTGASRGIDQSARAGIVDRPHPRLVALLSGDVKDGPDPFGKHDIAFQIDRRVPDIGPDARKRCRPRPRRWRVRPLPAR